MLPLELDKKQKFNGSKKLFPSNKESKTKMTNLICKRLSKASCNVMHAKGDPYVIIRGGSRAAAASQMEHFMIIVNGFQLLTIITKRSILDVAAALDPPLIIILTVAKESTNESATVIGEDADLFILLLYHTFSQT